MSTNTNTITTREFFEAVINANISDAVTEKAQALLEGLDKRNEKRKSADTKEKQAARARADAVGAFLLKNKGESFTRDSIAEALGISGAQVTAAARALGDIIVKSEVKIDKARRVVYSIAE